MMGKGSINHNTRAFSAKKMWMWNEVFIMWNFAMQRSKKFITNYLMKLWNGIMRSRNEMTGRLIITTKKSGRASRKKLFYEAVFQIGNKDDMNAKSEEGELAKEILIEFMKDFQKRNPYLHVFSAHLHMDEETPHVHVDFVPVVCNSKRGLDTRVSFKGSIGRTGL